MVFQLFDCLFFCTVQIPRYVHFYFLTVAVVPRDSQARGRIGFIFLPRAEVRSNALQHAHLWNGAKGAMERVSPCLYRLC